MKCDMWETENMTENLADIGETMTDIVRGSEIQKPDDSVSDMAMLLEPSREDMVEAGKEEAELEKENRDGAEYDWNEAGSINSVTYYFHEIITYPVLTKEEEQALAKKFDKGRRAEKELADSESEGKAIPKAKRAKLEKAMKEGLDAKDLLINSNLRLVVSIAKHFQGQSMTLLDLIQEGNMGLMKAVDMYDVDSGCKFSTYAYWWIKQFIMRGLDNQDRTVRIPSHMVSLMNRVTAARVKLTQELGRDPSVGELAERLEIEQEKLENIFGMMLAPVSLDAPVKGSDDEDDEAAFGNFVPDASDGPENAATDNIRKQCIMAALGILLPREKDVLIRRYGLIGGEPENLEAIARYYHVSRERIRQIEANALRKLRRSPKAKHLSAFLR